MRQRIALLLALALCALAPAAGAAAQVPATHELTLLLAGQIIEPGHIPIPPPDGEFEDVCGVAVSGGETYIADYYHRLIYVYDETPEYLRQIPFDEPGGPCNLAFDGSGDLYVNNWRRNVVRYTPGGQGSVIDSAGSTGVAYDPASERIYVDDRTYIAVYEPSGEAVLEGGQPLRIGLGSLQAGFGVGVSDFPATEGNLYVPDAAAGIVRVYGPAGEELAPIAGQGTPQQGFTSLVDANVLVTPADGHIYVADNLEPGFEHPAAAVDEFNPAGEYRGQVPHQLIDAEPTALALGPGGQIYVTSGNDEHAVLYGFGPTFAAHHLAVSTSGAGSGHVTSEPAGINCPPACGAEYNAGESLALSAVAEPGSAFVGWSGGGCSGSGLCHLQTDSDKAVEAEFALSPQAVTISASGPGETVAAPAPQQSPNRLRIGPTGSLSATARIEVAVPGPGELTATGKLLRPARLALAGGGVVSLRLALSRSGRRALLRSTRHRLAVEVAFSFAPEAGAALTAQRRVSFLARTAGR